jgi:hypothetical protein
MAAHIVWNILYVNKLTEVVTVWMFAIIPGKLRVVGIFISGNYEYYTHKLLINCIIEEFCLLGYNAV